MLDLNTIRADFAAYLVAHAATRHSLDAALMHVVERAYQQGIADGRQDPVPMPPMLQDPGQDLDAGLAAGMRSPLRDADGGMAAKGLPGTAPGAGQGGGSAQGHGQTASQAPRGGVAHNFLDVIEELHVRMFGRRKP